VNKLERGVVTDPHYSTLSGIARALGVPVEELVQEPVPLDEAPDQGPPQVDLEQFHNAGIPSGHHDVEELNAVLDALWHARVGDGDIGRRCLLLVYVLATKEFLTEEEVGTLAMGVQARLKEAP
jgi:transcriptional regulator with XRE-family HTH domain